jgi:predicted transcriptional regulator
MELLKRYHAGVYTTAGPMWSNRSVTGISNKQEPSSILDMPIESVCPFRYTENMTTKEKAVQAMQALPEDASLEDAMERLFLLAKIERGLQQADAGELIPHEKVKERMAKWLR